MASLALLIGFYWWFEGDILLSAIYAIVGFVATLTVPFLYRTSGFTLADEVEWLENREAVEHEQMLSRLSVLRSELDALELTEGVRQADTLTAILSDYHSVVETRFLGKKHSPMAYLSAARRVQKQAIQNLTDAVAVKHSIASISRNESGGDHGDRMIGLQKDQSNRLSALLANNTDLFAALTDTAVEVANIRSYSDYERMDTLARLVSLAEIASQSGK